MKRTRKTLVVALLLVVMLTAVFAFTACNKAKSGEKTVTLVVTAEETMVKVEGGTDYKTSKTVLLKHTVKTEKGFLIDLMEIVSKETDFDYKVSASGMLEEYSVNKTVYKTETETVLGKAVGGAYPALYTSLTLLEYILIDQYITEIVIEGKVNKPCGKGVKEMPLVDGATYFIALSGWGTKAI